ncbi:Multidrug resistance-associated protein 1 [Cytospora mali]|uniref:Multidrug resistance-associated protein 1 n=1 Tax=Cytospora mali TaxID=578113 RepID=A0A194UP70_CYTMA|nr:Multidrug resistance-associated protein 1 [Valsa mali var. pyri (nom. inval.)]
MGWSTHLSYRLMTMMRGQLISIICTKMLTLPITDVNESSAMSLMGTDIQTIANSFWYLLIQVVPNLVQVGIAVYLLYVQLGAVCVAPILVTIIATGLSVVLARFITSRQRAWLEAVQRRINFTSGILGSMRNVKMLGLTSQLSANIHQLRSSELTSSRRYRRVQSLNISLVNLPETFNAFFIFTAYAIVSQLQGSSGLSVSQAMTSLAALNLLAAPLGNLLYSIPQGWAALGCFERIQEFLLETPRTEQRALPSTRTSTTFTSNQEGMELQSTRLPSQNKIVVSKGSFGWSDSRSHIVKEVDTTIQLGSELTILVGPVGCGKSTFLKGLLGETSKLRGQVEVSSSAIAYCDQTPWIINGSIRDNIVAKSNFEAVWYATVCQACGLEVDFRQMPDRDSTVVGSKGVKLSGGQKQRISLARAVYSRKKLAIFDDVLSGLDSVTEELVFTRVFGRTGLLRKIGATVILATHSVKRLPQADLILVFNEDGRIVEQGSFAELNVAGNYIYTLKVKLQEEEAGHDHKYEIEESDDNRQALLPYAKAIADNSRKTGDWATYRYYARALGPWGMLMFVGLVTGNKIFEAMSNVWLNWWAENNENGGQSNLGYWLGMFGFLNFMEGFFMVGASAFLWIVMIPRSGKNLHQSILDAAMRAPLSFFAETETGVLVNRFSQDLRHADMTLPASIINCAFRYFAAVLPVVMAALYLIQNFYLRTSRQLRLLELEATAPLYTHFIESLAGLITIRSFGWVGAYEAMNRRLLDQSQKPYYLLLCIQRWLVLVLDLVVAGLALVLVGMAVALRSHMNPGFLGLALVNMMNLSHSLTNLVQYWTNLETTLGAIARIKDFAENTPVEGSPGEDAVPDADWPSQGALRFENVSASYGEAMSPVLKDISFSVEGGKKIGIVGRTGSGKSSSTLVILRLINVVSGRILLDDIDLATVPGAIVRERLVCLTQDPFLFPASVRANIDPLNKSSDEAIVTSLQRVGLWDALMEKAADKTSGASGVLATRMDADFLSHGQRQLFCLARAMLKSGKVLILDEPTSRQVAVAVLDEGKLVEFGRPAELLEDGSSQFSRLYNSSVAT